MRAMRKTMLVVMALAVSITLTPAKRDVSRTVSASSDATVEIESLVGSIRVEAWDRDEVEVTGTIGDDVEELDVSGDGDDISIEVELPDDDDDRDLDDVEAHLVIKVPRGSTVEIETVAGNIDVEGIEGGLGIEAVTSEINVDASVTELDIEAVSGNINVINGGKLRQGSIEAVSGTIDLETDLAGGAELDLEALSGGIVLRLPGNISASFEAETFSGDISNDFGPEPERADSMLPSKSLSFSVGGGDAEISLESFSGEIQIIRN